MLQELGPWIPAAIVCVRNIRKKNEIKNSDYASRLGRSLNRSFQAEYVIWH